MDIVDTRDVTGFFLTDKVKVKTLILEKDERLSLDNKRFNITILAEQIGWDRVRVSNVINNKTGNLSDCKFRTIQVAIANALGVDLSKILQLKEFK